MKDRGRQVAFTALGETVGDVSARGQGNLILWFCANTARLFSERKIKSQATMEAALVCFSRIAPFVDPGHLKQSQPFWALLDAVYELPLSKGLVEALQVVIIHHPAARTQVTTPFLHGVLSRCRGSICLVHFCQRPGLYLLCQSARAVYAHAAITLANVDSCWVAIRERRHNSS